MAIVTISLLPPPHSLLLHSSIYSLIHLLHPTCKLSVIKILLDQGQQEPVPKLTFGNYSFDNSIILQIIANISGFQHGYSQIWEYKRQSSAEATDDGNEDEEEEPKPLNEEYLVIDNVEAENTECVVDVDSPSQRARGELAGGYSGKH